MLVLPIWLGASFINQNTQMLVQKPSMRSPQPKFLTEDSVYIGESVVGQE